jgi:hypothetical protein
MTMTITVIDLATGEQRELPQDAPVLTPPLAQRRALAALDRAAFCTALMDHSILPGAEAAEAARGGWPASFAAAIAATGAEDLPAQIAWGAQVGPIGRLDPLVLAVLGWHAKAKGLKPAAAETLSDRLFGL